MDSLLVLTTPNILNIGSRLRFFLTGGYEYFKRPYNEHELHWGHLNPINSIQLVYILRKNGFSVQSIRTDKKHHALYFMLPFLPIIHACSYLQFVYGEKGGQQKRRNRDLLKRILSFNCFFAKTLIIQSIQQNKMITLAEDYSSIDKRFDL